MTEKRAYAVVDVYGFLGTPGDGLKAAIATAGFQPGDQVEIRPRVNERLLPKLDLLPYCGVCGKLWNGHSDKEQNACSDAPSNPVPPAEKPSEIRPRVAPGEDEAGELPPGMCAWDLVEDCGAPDGDSSRCQEEGCPLKASLAAAPEGQEVAPQGVCRGLDLPHAESDECDRWHLPDEPPAAGQEVPSGKPPALPEEVVCSNCGGNPKGCLSAACVGAPVISRPAHPPSSPSGTPPARSATPATPAEPEKLGEAEALRAENARLEKELGLWNALRESEAPCTLTGGDCTKIATCVGVADGEAYFGCDEHCGHGGEDQSCEPFVKPEPDGQTAPASSPPRSAMAAGPSTVATKGDK